MSLAGGCRSRKAKIDGGDRPLPLRSRLAAFDPSLCPSSAHPRIPHPITAEEQRGPLSRSTLRFPAPPSSARSGRLAVRTLLKAGHRSLL